MKLKLVRDTFTENSTIGQLYVDGKEFCYHLEDYDRKLESGGVKVYGKTCIPRGTYQVIVDFSPKYNKEMPHILNIPNFEGIRIHSGNKSEDTEGCILVGSTTAKESINSGSSAQDIENKEKELTEQFSAI